MNGTSAPTLVLLLIVVGCALALFGLVALGAEPAALPGVAAVIAALGVVVKPRQGE